MIKKFDSVFLEISSVCNANCPYCMSGRYRSSAGDFIDVVVFERILSKVIDSGLTSSDTVFGLYNWGEPFLHPQLNELVAIANRLGCSYSFSTNASRVPLIDQRFVGGLREIIFSMPGFSQYSYDRIHGFNFDTIRSNIVEIVNRTRACGYSGSLRINFHVYQFNLHEISLCSDFCRQHGIHLRLHYAILNHWDHLLAYISDQLPYTMLKEVSQDLFMFGVRSLVPEVPEAYHCPQYDILPIDTKGNVLLCCQVPAKQSYCAGNILTDNVVDIFKRRESNDVCNSCISNGLARYINTSLKFPLDPYCVRPTFSAHLAWYIKRIRQLLGAR